MQNVIIAKEEEEKNFKGIYYKGVPVNNKPM